METWNRVSFCKISCFHIDHIFTLFCQNWNRNHSFFPSANSAGMFGIWSDQSGNEAKTGNKLIYKKKLKSRAEKSHEKAKIITWVSLSIRCDPLTTSDVIYRHKLSWNLINSQWSSQCISLKILFWWTIYHGWG